MGQKNSTIQTFIDTYFIKAIQEMCKQMLGDVCAKNELSLWREKHQHQRYNREVARINDNLEFFECGATKLTKKDLIKDVIAKDLQGKLKTEFIMNIRAQVQGSQLCHQNHPRLQAICKSQDQDEYCKNQL